MIKPQISQEEMQEYGDFFRFMRQSIGFTLKQMGESINVPVSSLSKWERGQVPLYDINELESRVRKVVKTVKEKSKTKILM